MYLTLKNHFTPSGVFKVLIVLFLFIAAGVMLFKASTVFANTSVDGSVSTRPIPGVNQGGSLVIPFQPEKFPGVSPDVYRDGTKGDVKGVLDYVIDLILDVAAPVMVVMLVYFAIKMMIIQGDADEMASISRGFVNVLVGIGLVVFSRNIAGIFTFGVAGENYLVGEGLITATSQFRDQFELIIKLIRYTLGGIALFYVVRSGSIIIFNAYDEDAVLQQREVFLYGFVGFILIMVAETMVNVVFGVNTTGTIVSFNTQEGIGLLSNITNLLLASLSSLFLFTLVAGGALYAFSAGNEARAEQGQKVIIGSLIGLAIAFSSYTIVAEFSSAGRTVVPTPAQQSTRLSGELNQSNNASSQPSSVSQPASNAILSPLDPFPPL